MIAPDSLPCRTCGSTWFVRLIVHEEIKDQLLVVRCECCRNDIIPVVVNRFAPPADTYEACLSAWNKANTQNWIRSVAMWIVWNVPIGNFAPKLLGFALNSKPRKVKK